MKFTFFVCVFAFAVACTYSTPVLRQATGVGPQVSSPIGQWEIVDDATGKVNSVVLVEEDKGTLQGVIVKLVSPDPKDPNPRCTKCEGEMKDKSLIGLRILWGLRQSGDRWTGGLIVDPDNGKTYRCDIVVVDSGNKLKVRGYIGFSFFGRTEYWLRKGNGD
jgi:uncharacterized protein (DUF2147 family)